MPGRNHLMWGLFVLVLILGITIYRQGNRFVDSDETVRYRVSLDSSDRITVEARFTLEDTLLYLTHEGPDPKAYAPYLRDIRVKDERGAALTVTPCAPYQILRCKLWKGWERGRKWLVDADAGTPVTLTYDVVLEHSQDAWPAGLDSAAFRTDWGVFSTGRALFLMNGRIRSPFVSANLAWMEGRLVPREDSRQDVRVTFNLPAGWQASTPWRAAGENSFVADDLIDLSEAMMMLGTHDALQTEQGGTALTFALGGDTVLKESNRLQEAFTKAHAYYTDVFGGPPKTTREDPIERAIIIVNSHDGDEGEVIGANISVTFAEGQPMFEVSERVRDAPSLPIKVVFHELFHLWNGVTFASEREAEWFKEGVTEYYALRAVRQLGYADRATFSTLLISQYERHLKARAERELSLTEAGKDEFGNAELIYPGGLLVGLSLDLIIRAETRNEKSLDDLMKRIYAEYGASGRPVKTETVRHLAEELSGADLADFFNAYVEGANAMPLSDPLRLAGLEVVSDNGELHVNKREGATELEVAIRRDVF